MTHLLETSIQDRTPHVPGSPVRITYQSACEQREYSTMKGEKK